MKLDFLKEFEFFTGVPDSLLKPLCNYLMATYGISNKHVIAAIQKPLYRHIERIGGVLGEYYVFGL